MIDIRSKKCVKNQPYKTIWDGGSSCSVIAYENLEKVMIFWWLDY